jgi:TolB-like protein/class 3 adenylate cyclase/Flp pilus assembly protein TadD
LNERGTRRRLAAILVADVVGYSRLMAADDDATVSALDAARKVFRSEIESNQGRVIDMAGDSVLAVFEIASGAVNAALAIQSKLAAATAAVPEERRMRFRIGIHLGDIIEKADGTIYGDGVNIAARLQSLAQPCGVTVSEAIRSAVKGRLPVAFVDRGVHEVKNIAEPLQTYELQTGASPGGARTFTKLATGSRRNRRWLSASLAAAAFVLIGVGAWLSLDTEQKVTATVATGGAPIDTGTPSVAVLPFANLSGDSTKDYFSDGISEDITHSLGRFSGIKVIARNAVQEYKGREVPRDQISRELDVRYVVQGSVRRSGERLRVSVELSDPSKGILLWSERYEGEGREVFSMQDRIVRSIVGTLAVKLTHLEEKRAFAVPTENLEAYDLVLRARGLIALVSRTSNRQARALLSRVMELAPNYAEAFVVMADAQYQRAALGWMEDPGAALRQSQAFAMKALAADDVGAHARAHAILSRTYSFFLEFDRALSEAERAIELNPNDSVAYALRGSVLLWLGRLDDAIASLETARDFDPRPASDNALDLALAYYLRERYPEALSVCEAALARNPELPQTTAVKAATLARLGKIEAARSAAADVRRLSPFFQVETFGTRLVEPALRLKIQEGLRSAGL